MARKFLPRRSAAGPLAGILRPLFPRGRNRFDLLQNAGRSDHPPLGRIHAGLVAILCQLKDLLTLRKGRLRDIQLQIGPFELNVCMRNARRQRQSGRPRIQSTRTGLTHGLLIGSTVLTPQINLPIQCRGQLTEVVPRTRIRRWNQRPVVLWVRRLSAVQHEPGQHCPYQRHPHFRL